jgi:hypothetical protein
MEILKSILRDKRTEQAASTADNSQADASARMQGLTDEEMNAELQRRQLARQSSAVASSSPRL